MLEQIAACLHGMNNLCRRLPEDSKVVDCAYCRLDWAWCCAVYPHAISPLPPGSMTAQLIAVTLAFHGFSWLFSSQPLIPFSTYIFPVPFSLFPPITKFLFKPKHSIFPLAATLALSPFLKRACRVLEATSTLLPKVFSPNAFTGSLLLPIILINPPTAYSLSLPPKSSSNPLPSTPRQIDCTAIRSRQPIALQPYGIPHCATLSSIRRGQNQLTLDDPAPRSLRPVKAACSQSTLSIGFPIERFVC